MRVRVITVGNSVMGLYNLVYMCYTRYMTSSEHQSVSEMDQLVMEVQVLADLYVRCLDDNPSADVETTRQREHLEDLHQALARYFLAHNQAVRNLGKYYSGRYGVPTDGGDF